MSSNNNVVILDGCIERFKEENNLELSNSELFELFSLSQILKNEDITFENIQDSITDGGEDGGIDSIVILLDDEYIEGDTECRYKSNSTAKFIITQSKIEKTFKEGTLDRLITSFPVLFDLEKDELALSERFNTSVVGQIMILRAVWRQTIEAGGNIKIFVNYACKAPRIEINSVFQGKQQQLVSLCQDIFSVCEANVSVTCYSSQELLQLFQTQRVNKLTLEFKDSPLAINYGATGIGYIGIVKLSKYQKFISDDNGKIRERLFEANVRHFQGDVDVNKKIKASLECQSEKDFWWLNNGITIIVDNCYTMGKNLTLENIQIVNGLQTSFSIYGISSFSDDDDRSILVKIIVNNDRSIVDEIIESTNFQNAIPPSLLRATDPIQKELELFFLQNGYFYDRRKNYYKNLGKPSGKIFSINATAQAIKSIILQEPHTARATPTSIVKKDSSYKEVFDSQNDYRAYLNTCLLVSNVHNILLNLEDKNKKSTLINFKLHIALLTCIIKFNTTKYTIDNIANLDSSQFAVDIKNAISQMQVILLNYLQLYPDSNLINIAKSADFTNFILDEYKKE